MDKDNEEDEEEDREGDEASTSATRQISTRLPPAPTTTMSGVMMTARALASQQQHQCNLKRDKRDGDNANALKGPKIFLLMLSL